ncbi:MAG TPA: DUF11 domain-containing protein [Vicinamibacterales bacterium]
MKRVYFYLCAAVLIAAPLLADVSLTDKDAAVRGLARQSGAAAKAASKAISPTSKGNHSNASKKPTKGVTPFATGSIQLVDAGGLKYFINSNITFSTSSSASAGASEASYTHAVAASTLNGGTVASTLNDMFDGYNTLCTSLTNTTGTCQTGNANFTIYQKLGPASVDSTVSGANCTNRQYVFPVQTVGGLHVQRKIYVPPNDKFARWENIFTNTTGAPITFSISIANNLGSDSNTVITGSSSGDLAAQTNDTWVTTFQNYSGTTTSDPRIGHILQGTGAATPVSAIFFANGNDNPWWSYSITLAPGQTKIILNYVTGAPSKALAASQAAAIASYGATEQQCLSATELSEVANFSGSDLSITKTASTATAIQGIPFTYTIQVSNAGPATATSLTMTDTLPAGLTYVSASGTGWTCGFATGTVTCTLPSLAPGPAAPIHLVVTPSSSGGTIVNTATVSSASSDPVSANNTITTPPLPVLPSSAIPLLDKAALAFLAAVIAVAAAIAMKR